MLLLLFWYLRLPVLVLSINAIRFSRGTIWWLILPSVTSLAEEAWQICWFIGGFASRTTTGCCHWKYWPLTASMLAPTPVWRPTRRAQCPAMPLWKWKVRMFTEKPLTASTWAPTFAKCPVGAWHSFCDATLEVEIGCSQRNHLQQAPWAPTQAECPVGTWHSFCDATLEVVGKDKEKQHTFWHLHMQAVQSEHGTVSCDATLDVHRETARSKHLGSYTCKLSNQTMVPLWKWWVRIKTEKQHTFWHLHMQAVQSEHGIVLWWHAGSGG